MAGKPILQYLGISMDQFPIFKIVSYLNTPIFRYMYESHYTTSGRRANNPAPQHDDTENWKRIKEDFVIAIEADVQVETPRATGEANFETRISRGINFQYFNTFILSNTRFNLEL